MGVKISEIKENTRVVFHIQNGEQQMDLGAFLKKHLENNLAVITLDYTGSQRLSFNTVKVDMECAEEDGIPILWEDVKIVNYKNAYILQAPNDGARNNRRGSYRVSIGKKAWFSMEGRKSQYVMIKDISISGFGIADRKRELNLKEGDQLSVILDDLNFHIELDGRVTRIEERDGTIVYGMVITNLCQNLSAYINTKQRPIQR